MSDVTPYFGFLEKGLLVTLQVTALAMLVAVPVSFVAGLGRLSRPWAIRAPSSIFIEVFRGTSVVVQLFWFFYALPLLGLRLAPMEAAVAALGLNEGAYAAEIVRGAILAVPRGQREGATALNMTPVQRMRRVILPQAIPHMLPAFGNVAIDTLKATALVSLVTVSDLTFRGQIVRSSTGATTAVFGVILVAYFAMACVLSLLRRWLEVRADANTASRSRPFLTRLRLKGQVTS